MTLDTTVHLSDLLVSAVLPFLGWGLMKIYKAVSHFVERVELTADVVDTHTDVLTRAGWARGVEIPRVGSKPSASMTLALLLALFCAAPLHGQVVVSTLQELRPLYPTPMSKEQLSDLLNKAAAAHPGWMMLRKEAGNNCPTPSGKKISCDWLIDSTTQWGWDVIRDQEGVAAIGVGGSGAIAPGTELVMPWDVAAPPQPPPQPVATTPTAPVWQPPPTYMFDIERLYQQNERIFANLVSRFEAQELTLKAQAEALRLHDQETPGWVRKFFTSHIGVATLTGLGTMVATWQAKK